MPVYVPSIVSKLNWAILPISCIMIGFCYLDRSNIAYMQLQLKLPPPLGLDFSEVVYGHGSGMFFIGYSLFQIPSNLVLTRLGAPLWLTIIVVCWGFFASCMAYMRNATHFMLLRLVLGIFEAGTFPGIWYHMSLFYPNEEMTLPLSASKSAVMIAQVLSSPIAALLMSLHGTAGMPGWQWLCLVEGVATMMVGLTIIVFLPRAPASIKSLTHSELAWINKGVSRPPSTSQLLKGLVLACTNRDLWKLTVVFGTKSCAAYSLIFWTPLVIADLLGPENKDPNLPIMLTSIPYIFAAAFTYLIGWSSHARGERRLHVAIPFTIGGTVLLLSPFLRGPAVAFLSFVALCIALSMSNGTGPLTAMVMASLPSEAQAAGLALHNSGANLGGYVGPALFGWLKQSTGTHAAGMAAMGALLLIGAVTMFLFDEQAALARACDMGVLMKHNEELTAHSEPLVTGHQSSAEPKLPIRVQALHRPQVA